jgi:two-component system chemotaxis sensor kinase CheA
MMEDKGRTKEDLLEAHRQGDMRFVDLQELIMKIRMVPIGPMFRQYIRAVRDVAQTSQKIARLAIEGANAEVDTTVIEHLKDPLTHMIRNAMDHGIEPPAKRKEAGKDPCGCITLRASHEAGSVVIQVEDDGAGLNRQKILEKAISRGMISDGRNLSDEEVYRFIFEPGFSTAEKVTELSGRGVGMDVVRRNIEALRGSVAVESREGKGTTITLRLPLTLAIIDGFGVGVGEETYVIPLEAVIECLEIPAESRERQNSQGVINLRGKPLPCLRLRDFFGLKGTPPKRESIIVVHQGNKQVGLVVDILYGENQAVIKPLGKMFNALRAVSGSTILGNGRVALILDVPALLRDATGRPEASGVKETAVRGH